MGNTLNVKVGDKVIVNDNTIGVVEKITPKGFIKVDGNLYYPSGEERASTSHLWSYHGHISEYTEEKEREIVARNARRKTFDKAYSLCGKVSRGELKIDLGTAKKLVELLGTTEKSE